MLHNTVLQMCASLEVGMGCWQQTSCAAKYHWGLIMPGPAAPAETCPIFLLPPVHQQMSHIIHSFQHRHQLCFVHYGQPLTLCFFPEQIATVCLEKRRKRSRARVGAVTISRCALKAGWE